MKSILIILNVGVFSLSVGLSIWTLDTIQCPDKEFSCQDHETCCHLAVGGYGCCPLPQAVCCPDGYHCCRNGTECDMTLRACVPKPKTMAADMTHNPVREVIQVNGTNKGDCLDDSDVQCLDGRCCGQSATCCPTKTKMGCCPMEHAVCCADLATCCPKGTQCGSRFETTCRLMP